jgi:hypothetical protein
MKKEDTIYSTTQQAKITSRKVKSAGSSNSSKLALRSPSTSKISIVFNSQLNDARFPASCNLRTQYAYFLYEFLNDRQRAAEQLAYSAHIGGLSI